MVEAESEGSLDEPPAIFIDPKPPEPGESPDQIVTDFLEAQTATPLSTNVARQYLTGDADAAWDPEAETITYADASRPRGTDTVTVRLDGADRLDGRGSFRGPLPANRRTLEFPMELEDGEWRIAQRARRADRAGVVVRAAVPPGVALLLRPERAGAGARTGVRAARRAVHHGAHRGAAARPRADPGQGLAQLHPAGPRLRPLRARLRGGRRRPQPARLLRPADARGQRADDHPARVDAEAGARRSRRSGSPSVGSRSPPRPGRACSAWTSARCTTRPAWTPARSSTGCATG